jgi:selenocysteine lyase/cysteine desulfurase
MAALDVDRARALTPGCDHVLHLNHAGASLAPQPVLDAVIEHLRLEADIGSYEAALRESERLEGVYDSLATLIGARRDELALTDSSTRGWLAAVHALPISPGDRVITTRAEYAANAITLLQLRDTKGCEIVLIDDDRFGQLDLDAMARALEHDRTAFVSVVHVPTQGGLVNPVAAVGALCRSAGVPLVVDACQSVGQLPLDVEAIQCDVLTGAGRKFLRGPRGTGFLYVRRTLLERLSPPMLDLFSAEWTAEGSYTVRDDARRFELWERNVASQLGLGTAIDHALEWGLDAIATRNRIVADALREHLRRIPGVTVHDLGLEQCAITTFQVAGLHATDVVARLRTRGINVSASGAAWARYDLPRRGIDALVRASVHYLTTFEEIERAAEVVAALAGDAA